MKISRLATSFFTMCAMLLVFNTLAAQKLERKTGKETPTRTAIIVVNKDGLVFIGDKAHLIKSMQTALVKAREKAVVRDIIIQPEKPNYLVVRMEEKKSMSSLFIELVPVGEGSAYYTNGPHVVTCVNTTNCAKNCFVIPPYSANNPDPSPHCDCIQGNTPAHSCNFKINKSYMPQLLADFNLSLAAAGYELTGGDLPTEKRPRSDIRQKN